MNIGVYWSPDVLEHKLERLEQPGEVEEVWNCRRFPQGLGQDPGGDRLFVASQGCWVGCFRIVPEVLYNPDDAGCPYTLIFDVKSWKSLRGTTPRRRFRGWTYSIPDEVIAEAAAL